jgi:hypothetical protein
VDRFLAEQGTHALEPTEQIAALKLLEMQRHAMLMYTSCGWFFDELSGLETVQVIQYAGRAINLAQDFSQENIESQFLDRLAAAKSNLPEHGDGKQIYEKWVKPALVTTDQVAGHYAISSLFESYAERTRIYCYDVDREDYSLEVEGKHKLAVGRARFSSEITRETEHLGFGVLHLGDHNIAAGVSRFDNLEDYEKLKSSLTESFSQADATGALHTLAQQFPGNTFSLRTLFRDEQRKIVNIILNDSLATTAAAYRTIYENEAALIRFLTGLRIPVPAAFQAAAEIALNNQLKQEFEREEPDTDSIQSHLKEAAASNVTLDVPGLEFAIRKRLEREATIFATRPTNIEAVQKLRKLLEFVATFPFPVTLWEVQNISYAPLTKAIDELRPGAESHIETENTLQELNLLREKLRINGK